MNTLNRHKEQIQKATNWLAKTKYSSATLLQEAADRSRRGFADQLKDLGLCVIRHMPGNIKLIGLSEHGARMAGTTKFDIHKVGDRAINHHLTAQQELLWLLRQNNQIADYEFEPQTSPQDTRPDIVLKLTNGEIINLEIELSEKHIKRGEMDRMFGKITSVPTIVIFKEQRLMDLYVKHALRYIQNGIPVWEKIAGEWRRSGREAYLTEFDWCYASFKMHQKDIWVELADLIPATDWNA
jgi:hypothetical protein